MKLADLTSHHIEGIALHGDTPFNVPLFSHIVGNLWSGGCPVGEAPEEFEYIVNLYPWEPYDIQSHQVVTKAQIFDSSDIPKEEQLYSLAAIVNEYRH